MEFKRWLLEFGGDGGVGGGLVPPMQNPLSEKGAFSDHYDDSNKDSRNQNGKLPPVKKQKKRPK